MPESIAWLACIAVCATLLAAPPARADAPATLAQALVDAYNYNATLQQQRATLRATDEQVPTALSGWRPTVDLTGQVGRITGNETFQSVGFNGLPVTQHLPQSRNEAIDQIQLTQPIFAGGKTIAQTREAKNTVYAARAQLLAAEQSVFLNVVNAYVTIITDAQIVALDESNVRVSVQQLQATQDQFNTGEITLTSVAQAQASLAQAKEQQEIAAGNLQVARENFHDLVGLYPAAHLAPPQPLSLPVASAAAAGRAALANNPNVIAAQFTNAANKDAVDVAFSVLLPQVSVQASAYNQYGSAGPNSRITGGQVLGVLTVPLYQGGSEYAAIRQARATEQESFAAVLNQQRSAYANATQSWAALISSRAAIISTNAEIKANAIALDGTERQELVGTSTTFDVLYQQQLLLNSQVQQVQNIATLVNNSYQVAAAIGRLTATDLGLPVHHYNDEKYYDDVEYAGFGTGGAADARAGIAPDGSLLAARQPPLIADGPALPAP